MRDWFVYVSMDLVKGVEFFSRACPMGFVWLLPILTMFIELVVEEGEVLYVSNFL